MKHSTRTLMALALTSGIALATPIAANADSIEIARETAPTVIAQAPARTFTATASIPGGIVVKGHAGRVVSLTTQGAEAINRSASASTPIVFKDLVPGRRYEIWVHNEMPLAVTPVANVADASGLVVMMGDEPGSIDLTWRHQRTAATGGASISYVVSATSPTAATVTKTVTNTNKARLTGLHTNAKYTFTVTPKNTATTGRPTKAVMSRTLGELLPAAQAPVEASTTPSTPIVQTAPVVPVVQSINDAPAPAPGPRTKTIYVCPAGYTEVGSTCEKTMAHTYKTVTETKSYTYTTQKIGTETYTDTCSSGYTDADGNFHWVEQPHACTKTRDVYGPVKDATPAGFSDNGTEWVKTTQVKDATPSGYSDNGTEWVTTTAKVATEVPA